MTDAELELLADRIAQDVRTEVLRQLKSTGRTMDEIERAVEDLGRRIEAEVEQAILDVQPDPAAYENQATCPKCQGVGRYRESEARRWTTLHGVRTVVRRRFYCSHCREGFAPRDGLLGLDDGKLSYALREQCSKVAALVDSFETAQKLLWEQTGVELGESTVARTAIAVGQSLCKADHAQALAHHAGARPRVERKPQRLYVSVDGIFAPIRQEWKRDGSRGALVCEWRECKTAVVYETDRKRDEKTGRLMDRKPVYRTYTASFDESGVFGQRVAAMAQVAGKAYAKEVIFLADGQKYNWTIASTHFPRAVKIIDEMHAFEHLGLVMRTFFGAGTEPGATWLASRKDELNEDAVEKVVSAIKDLEPRTDEQREIQAREAEYFRKNAARMRYQTFRARGYQVASGVMEAACKQVVHQRVDQVGMHWREAHAEAMVCLRAKLLSSRPPNLRPHCTTAG
jgi:hypothetical protein